MNRNLSTYGQKLLNIARVGGKDASQALDMFLDYLIGVFDIDNIIAHDYDFDAVFADAKEKNEDFFVLMFDWINEVTREMECGGWLDFFGGMYESMFQYKSKASALGQFYTPDSLCNLMAEITVNPTIDNANVNDCACGSGRTLLAAWAKMDKAKFHQFDAADIDYVSCKMCALNMMIHGMYGEVRQQNTLTMSKPVVTYKVNEIRYPIPTPFYSIRIITK